MTEDQAKEKWCPFARVPLTNVRNEIESGSPVVNRCTDGRINSSVLCIGSACMAWRISHRERGPVVERIQVAPGSRKPEGEDWGYEAIDPERSPSGGEWVRWDGYVAHGFCGLAGRPE